MIFVERPRHISSAEAETWLEEQLHELVRDGVDVELKPLLSASLRFSESWAWMLEARCSDAEAARETIRTGAGLALLADLRMLGMRPSVAVVEERE